MSLPARAMRLAACALAGAIACRPDFQSPSQVTDLRVLAIRQEAADANGPAPFADAFVDLAAGTAQSVRVKALVADPHPRQSLVARARVCSPTDSGRCDDVPAFDVQPPFNGVEPAVEQRPEYPLDIPREVVALAQQDDRLKGFGGIRVQFSLEASDGDPHGTVMASKILLYTTAQDSLRNHDPDVVALEITREGAHFATVAAGGSVGITAGVQYGVRPVLGPGGAGIEEYDAVDLSGRTIRLRETPRYSFFSTVLVDFDRDEADEPLPGQPQPVNGIARFTAGAGSGPMWVVARDGRGGIGWISVQWTASPP